MVSNRPAALFPSKEKYYGKWKGTSKLDNINQFITDPYKFSAMQNELPAIDNTIPENGYEWNTPANLFELTNTVVSLAI